LVEVGRAMVREWIGFEPASEVFEGVEFGALEPRNSEASRAPATVEQGIPVLCRSDLPECHKMAKCPGTILLHCAI